MNTARDIMAGICICAAIFILMYAWLARWWVPIIPALALLLLWQILDQGAQGK